MQDTSNWFNIYESLMDYQLQIRKESAVTNKCKHKCAIV